MGRVNYVLHGICLRFLVGDLKVRISFIHRFLFRFHAVVRPNA